LIEVEEIFVICKAKPETVIKRVSERCLEDNLLEDNPEFLSSLEKAKEEHLKLGGLSIDEYLGKRRT
jgi:hypothetical protein